MKAAGGQENQGSVNKLYVSFKEETYQFLRETELSLVPYSGRIYYLEYFKVVK